MGRPKRKEQSDSPVKDSDATKRMRQTSTPVSFDFSETKSISDFGKAVLKMVNEAKDPRRGHLIAADFQTLPDKEDLPLYFTIIKEPIALDIIETKFDSYTSFEQLLDDFRLMESNANLFNKTNSLIAQYSTKIRSLVEESVEAMQRNSQVPSEADPQSDSNGVVPQPEIYETLLGFTRQLLNEVRDSTGTSYVGDFFRILPPKANSMYYQVISRPMSLTMIQKRLKSKEYPVESVIPKFEDDMLLIISNCRQFNEPGSEFCKDAEVLEKWITEKMAELRKSQGLPPRTLIAKSPEPEGEPMSISQEDSQNKNEQNKNEQNKNERTAPYEEQVWDSSRCQPKDGRFTVSAVPTNSSFIRCLDSVDDSPIRSVIAEMTEKYGDRTKIVAKPHQHSYRYETLQTLPWRDVEIKLFIECHPDLTANNYGLFVQFNGALLYPSVPKPGQRYVTMILQLVPGRMNRIEVCADMTKFDAHKKEKIDNSLYVFLITTAL